MDLGFVDERVREISKLVAEKGGFEFVRSEVAGTKRNPIVRVFIDKVGGVSVEHCADVSREIEAILDAEDLIPSKFVLEVSSPGLERGLYSIEDFRRFSGKLVKLKTNTEIEGSKTIVGYIKSIDGDSVALEVREGKRVTVPYSEVAKANLKIDLDAEFRKK
ncbi:MAG: ribosome maturation factor RimP [Acidobacteria bacterium]|nr:MAG: ribosome maturation factor RimP [Acidobacteriota bacterium]